MFSYSACEPQKPMLSRRHSSARLPEILLIAHSELHIAVRIALSLPRSPSTLPAHDIVRLVQTPQHRFPTSPRLELPNDVPPPLAPQLVFALIRTQDISVLSKVIQLLNAISRAPPPISSLFLSLFLPSSQAPISSPPSPSKEEGIRPLTSVTYPTYPTTDGTATT